jgi:hypothetical protein
MDAINYDRPRRSSQSTEGLEQDERRGQQVGGLLNLVQRGVGVTARKDYSLAPCCHIFVSGVDHIRPRSAVLTSGS